MPCKPVQASLPQCLHPKHIVHLDPILYLLQWYACSFVVGMQYALSIIEQSLTNSFCSILHKLQAGDFACLEGWQIHEWYIWCKLLWCSDADQCGTFGRYSHRQEVAHTNFRSRNEIYPVGIGNHQGSSLECLNLQRDFWCFLWVIFSIQLNPFFLVEDKVFWKVNYGVVDNSREW